MRNVQDLPKNIDDYIAGFPPEEGKIWGQVFTFDISHSYVKCKDLTPKTYWLFMML